MNGSFAARYHCVNGSTRDGRAPAAPCRLQGDLHERADALVDLRVRPPEGSELLIVAALDLGWVLQSPVEPFPVAGAVLGAVDAAPFEHAPKAMVASNASAPMRFDVVMVTRCSSS